MPTKAKGKSKPKRKVAKRARPRKIRLAQKEAREDAVISSAESQDESYSIPAESPDLLE